MRTRARELEQERDEGTAEIGRLRREVRRLREKMEGFARRNAAMLKMAAEQADEFAAARECVDQLAEQW